MSFGWKIAMGARSELVAVLSLAIGCAACAPPPQPKQMPPQAVTQQTPDPPPPSDPPPAVPVKAETVVVDPGGSDADKPPTLAEVSRAEKERRSAMSKPAVAINDKNLSQYAAKGQITTAQPAPRETTKPTPPADGHGEDYWRARGREIRQRWHDAVAESRSQQLAVEKLRTAFYSEDDPYVRDGRIKPEWDHALQRLDESRRAGEAAKKDLDAFMDEGQRAGAYQAWLEDGIDLEPPPAPAKPKPATEPNEPKVINDIQEPPPHG